MRYKNFYRVLFLAALLFNPIIAAAQSLAIPQEGRNTVSLNGSWNSIIDPYENGYYDYRYQPKENGFFVNRQQQDKSDLVEYNFERSENLNVPGDWNTQRRELFFYEGTVWYHKRFDYDLPEKRRLFVWVGAANYEAITWLNGEELGRHTGGFTPFWFEITDLVGSRNNDLVFKVDNKRRREGVPTLNTDWWNFGGLTRDVLLMEVPSTFIRDYTVQLDPENPEYISGSVVLDGDEAERKVTIIVPEAGLQTTVLTDTKGRAKVRIPAPDLERWSPDNPKLYQVEITAGSDMVRERIGFRTIETKGEEILLNGKPVFLKGISTHEVNPIGEGRAYRPEDAKVLLGWAKEMGCNFVRLAHYPHNRHMTRKADEMGLMIWSEIPVYWTILWENTGTYQLAEQQLREMIQRDKNRASVIIWSIGNETPRKEARLEFMTKLTEEARRLDSTRLLSAATELSYEGNTLKLDDPLAEHLDVIGANEYLGWYGGRPEDIPDYTWESAYNKPLVVSEFGGGALYNFHGDPATRWSEEYQASVYRNQLKMLDRIPFLAGVCPWILVDFLSPRRLLPDIQDYFNRKGLISERGYKKQAFYIMQEYYLDK